MKHYLKALKQKNSLLFSVGIVMLLVLTLCLSGCSEKNEVQDQTNGADRSRQDLCANLFAGSG